MQSELSFTHLSTKVGVDKSIIENVLVLLEKIGLIHLIPKFGNLSHRVRKEYKILLGNTNLYSAYNLETDIGILRESFFLSVMRRIDMAQVSLPRSGDYRVSIGNEDLHFELGGKNNGAKQLPGGEHSYVIRDGIIVGEGQIIPLWIFGLVT